MQKGPILMEPITIKARPNQAYHFSGAAETGIRFSDLSDDPAFVFREDTSAVHNRFVPAGGASATRPRPSDTGCAAIPPLSLCRIRKRHFNDCRRRCAGAGILPACTGDLMLLPDQTAYRFSTTHTPFCYHCFYLSTEYFSEYLPFLCADDRIFMRTEPRRMTSYGVFCPASPASCSQMNRFPRFI